MKRYFLFSSLSLLALLGFCLTLNVPSVHAQTNFNYTDHLMDDAVFRSSATMSASDIQTFLQNTGSGLATFSDTENCGSTSGIHYTYYAQYFSCGSTQLASKIIYDASQAYGINPQVILATLQKEEALITTPNPVASQLNYAMGYGCPDSGGCSYPGFFTQVDNATWQFRFDYERLTGNLNWWTSNSNASYPCSGGGTPVHSNGGNVGAGSYYYSTGLIPGNNVTFFDYNGDPYAQFVLPNASTAALYCYTPHVYSLTSSPPFSGSHWFVYYFNLWFVPYSWKMVSQNAYTDSARTVVANMNNIAPGTPIYLRFTALNTGSVTWLNSGPNALMVGTAGPMERTSVFSGGSGWLSSTKPALLKDASVAPGATGTFEFTLTAPITPGTGGVYNERFNILANGITWLNDVGLSYYLNVQPPTYIWKMTSQYAYTDASKTTTVNMNNVTPGQKIWVGFTAQNTGSVTWQTTGPNAVMVGTAGPLERASAFSAGSGWLSSTRPAILVPSISGHTTVAPGESGTFEFWLTAPITPGTGGVYNERFNILANGITWFNDVGLSYYVNAQRPTYSWKMTSETAYTDVARTLVADINNITPGQKIYVGFTAQNTGSVTWQNSGPNALMVGTAGPLERASAFSTGSGWLTSTRPVLLKEPSVAPTGTGTFEFVLTAPNTPGIYNERFNILSNGITWLNDTGLSYYFNVH